MTKWHLPLLELISLRNSWADPKLFACPTSIISRLLAKAKPEMAAKAIHRVTGPDTELCVAACGSSLVQMPDKKSKNTIAHLDAMLFDSGGWKVSETAICHKAHLVETIVLSLI